MCHQSQSSAISATPATQSGDRCRQVPRLPRKVTVDVAKCHACHANSGRAYGTKWEPSASEPAQCQQCHACHANSGDPTAPNGNQARHQSQPDVANSATPATQTAAAPTAPNGNQARHQSQRSAISATPATQSDDLCREVPRLPSKDHFLTFRCAFAWQAQGIVDLVKSEQNVRVL